MITFMDIVDQILKARKERNLDTKSVDITLTSIWWGQMTQFLTNMSKPLHDGLVQITENNTVIIHHVLGQCVFKYGLSTSMLFEEAVINLVMMQER